MTCKILFTLLQKGGLSKGLSKKCIRLILAQKWISLSNQSGIPDTQSSFKKLFWISITISPLCTKITCFTIELFLYRGCNLVLVIQGGKYLAIPSRFRKGYKKFFKKIGSNYCTPHQKFLFNYEFKNTNLAELCQIPFCSKRCCH